MSHHDPAYEYTNPKPPAVETGHHPHINTAMHRGHQHNRDEYERSSRDLRRNRTNVSPGRQDYSDYRTRTQGSRGYDYNGRPLRNYERDEKVRRLPFTTWMGRRATGHLVAFIGEFLGTIMFLFFAFAGTHIAKSKTAEGEAGVTLEVLSYVSLSFGFSLMINVWIFYRISGGLFNPAVTLAMALIRALSPFRSALLLIAQLCGAMLSSYLVKVIFPGALNVRTTLSTETSITRGVFIEIFCTAELMFAILMLAQEKHKATFMAPIGIGLALFVAELVGVNYTGGSLNPARSFGPCVVDGVWDSEHWIYWVGPLVGAIFAVIFYKLFQVLQYELANPGQDEDSERRAELAAKKAEQKMARNGGRSPTGMDAV